jgi:hypothetical protein
MLICMYCYPCLFLILSIECTVAGEAPVALGDPAFSQLDIDHSM